MFFYTYVNNSRICNLFCKLVVKDQTAPTKSSKSYNNGHSLSLFLYIAYSDHYYFYPACTCTVGLMIGHGVHDDSKFWHPPDTLLKLLPEIHQCQHSLNKDYWRPRNTLRCSIIGASMLHPLLRLWLIEGKGEGGADLKKRHSAKERDYRWLTR